MRRFLAFLACGGLLGCGSSTDLAGGGGIEGETVTVNGIALRPDGTPLGNAAVALRAPDWTEGDPERLAQTDGSGRFALTAPARRSFQIEVRRDSLWMHRSLETSGNDLALDLPTRVGTTWTARVVAPAGRSAVRVDLYGGRSSSLATAGKIALWRDPGNPGAWARVLLDDGSQRDIALPPVTDSVLDLTREGILVEDFESVGNRSALGYQVGSGWWYAVDDSAQGGTARILPEGTVHDISKAFVTDSAWSGRGLSVSFVLDASRPVHYAQIGLDLAPRGQWVDLTSLDSLTFMARGDGSLQLRLQTSTGFDLARDFGGDYVATAPLPAGWTRIVVKPSDLKPLLGQIPSAREALGRVRRVIFHSEGPMALRMDDLRFHGPALRDLIPEP